MICSTRQRRVHVRDKGFKVSADRKGKTCKNGHRERAPLPNIVATLAEGYRYRIVAGFVTSSSPVALKTRRVGQRCTLNLSKAETSSRGCGVVVRRGCASSGVICVT
ncbi:uncharacterized protein TNCV_1622181 [Trichonephila clavipes]|nr:uncharacterized protein TNCV_1622181 [Trichonephila clavipes]